MEREVCGETRKCPVSETDNRVRKQKRGEEVGGEGVGGGTVENKRTISDIEFISIFFPFYFILPHIYIRDSY